MRKHIYIHGTEAAFTLEINGVTRSIVFSGGRVVGSLRQPFYWTNDVAEQKAIEALSCFGTLILPEDESRAKADQEIVGLDEYGVDEVEQELGFLEVGSHPEVTKIQEAKSVLINTYGLTHDGLLNKAATLGAAKEVGASFPNLK